MTRVKTSTLTGAALDWAVATIEGLPIRHDPMGFGNTENGGYWVWESELGRPYLKIGPRPRPDCNEDDYYSPSTRWILAGLLIERYRITLVAYEMDWQARIWSDELSDFIEVGRQGAYCLTPLIAAMRCLVMFKLGSEIDVPEELLP